MGLRARTTLRWILRILVAALFVVSAVSKIVGINQFGLYVYSFGFLPLALCHLLVRLCIGVELVLALFTLFGWFPRTLRLLTCGMLLLFSLFLCYSALIGREDNCQCFGQLVDLNPMQSLLKNALLLALVLFYYRLVPPKPCLNRRWLLLPLLLAALLMAVPFIDYDFANADFNKQKFHAAAASGGELRRFGVGEGRRLVILALPGCPYCRMARHEIDSIVSANSIPTDRIVYLEPAVDKNSPDAQTIPRELFLDITKAVPQILLLDGEHIAGIYGLEDLNPYAITQFFTTAN